MSFKYKITLFTPTYNRAYILNVLYRSVQRQTYRNFEWIIMDDGSTDNTEDLVRSWIADNNDFPIRYYKVPNGGKCRAINRGLDLAEGELFFIMDSDDYLTDDSLETVVKWEATIAGKPGYCGVAGNRGSSPTETPNTSIRSMYGTDFIETTTATIAAAVAAYLYRGITFGFLYSAAVFKRLAFKSDLYRRFLHVA